MAITQTITTIPTAGHRGVDARDTFVTKQEAFQDALTDNFVTEINAFRTQANALETNVNAKEASAVIARDEAVQARDEAVGAVSTLPDGIINDGIVSPTDTWSSEKIDEGKQDTLVSGTNIKTIGGVSILGGGDLVVGATNYQEFTTSGTWTKPEGINCVYVEAIGGGAGACPTVGGGGGAFNSKFILASSLSSTVTITVGAGGDGTATANTTTAGGNSTFDIYLTAQGGYGGNFTSPFTIGMGGGGEAMSATSTNGGSSGSFSSGAGGYTNAVRAGNCIKGGAGGSGCNGGVYSPAGVSTDGGNGGSNGANGSFPGGGGSAKATTGANGANGRVRVWAW